MSNERKSHRIAVVLFAAAVIIAIVAAFVTTLEQAGTGTANNETPPLRRASLSHTRHWIARQASRCWDRRSATVSLLDGQPARERDMANVISRLRDNVGASECHT